MKPRILCPYFQSLIRTAPSKALRGRARTAVVGQADDEGRGTADRGQRGKAAGAVTQGLLVLLMSPEIQIESPEAQIESPKAQTEKFAADAYAAKSFRFFLIARFCGSNMYPSKPGGRFMFYVVQPLYVDAEPKAFLTPKAANEYVNKGPHGADVCEVSRIEAASNIEALAKVKAGEGEKHTMHRLLTKEEIAEQERRDAIDFLRDLGL